MSAASFLNLASAPGAGAQPGAAQGIAQQAAQAAQAKGPLAGFEALLAAFFGDQGVGQPAGAGVAQGPLAFAAAQAASTGKATDAKGAKAANATPDGDKTGADATGADTAAAAAAANGAVDAAALALITPQAAPPTQTPTQPVTADTDPGGAQPSPDGLAAKPAFVQVAAAAIADAKAAKAAALGAQVTSDAGQPTQTTADQAQQPAAPKTAAPPTPAAQLQTPGLSDQPAAVAAQTLPPPGQAVAAQVRAGDPQAASQPKEKALAIKSARVEGAPASPPAPNAYGKTGEALQAAAADGSGKDAGAEERDPNAPAAPAEAKAPAPDANAPAGGFNTALNAQAANANQALAHAAALVRGSPQTVANLAAQIAKKLDGRSTRFDVQLDPAGLGKVDVRVEIDAAGKVSAALNFDNQQAATELKSRAGELQRALEQAGFELSGGLSFDVSGQGGQAQQDSQDAPVFRGRAFQAVLEGGADSQLTPQTAYRTASSGGVDIRI